MSYHSFRTNSMKDTIFSLNSYQLKYIALFTMIIDHTGIVFRENMTRPIYLLMRGIGRISFPIFAFLLVEGFFYTHNRKSHLIRLVIFCLLSEIPFDFVLKGTYRYMSLQARPDLLMYWAHQNVFFTLTIGFLAMAFMEYYPPYEDPYAAPAAVMILLLIAEYTHTDYAAAGVLTVLFFYIYKKYQKFPFFLCYLPLILLSYKSHIEIYSLMSLPLLYLYNGEKGRGIRGLFYLAYPLHMIILWICKISLF